MNCKALTIWALCLMLQACATQPQTFEEALAAGYALIETAADSVVAARDGGLITPEKAQEHRQRLQIALDGLTAAREAHASLNEQAANARLEIAIRVTNMILEDLQR